LISLCSHLGHDRSTSSRLSWCVAMFPPLLLSLWLTQAGQDCPPAVPSPRPIVARVEAPDHPDESESFEFVFAMDAGGGTSAAGNPSLFGGLKIGFGCCIKGKHPYETGRTITLDLGYDRAESHNGFSSELSVMIPVVRFPRPRSEASNYLRVYAEPGVGVRAGKGFGTYASGKVMLAWLSDQRIFRGEGSPFVEIQGRFTVLAPHRRDIRILAGAIVGLCKHCGFD
jgi:hypothetical protein